VTRARPGRGHTAVSERLTLHLDRMLESAIQARHPTLPWSAMRGMRNRTAHRNVDIDMAIVWETVQRDLPPLIAQLTALRAAGDEAL